MIISEHLSSSRVVIIMVTGHYNSLFFFCIILIDFSHLLDAINLNSEHTSIIKPAGATDSEGTSLVWQFSRRFGLGLGTCYSIYLYIYYVLLAPFLYWHKQLKLAVQSVWKELTHGKKMHPVESVFVEGRNICDCIFFLFSLLSGIVMRQVSNLRVNHNNKVWFINRHLLTNTATLYLH